MARSLIFICIGLTLPLQAMDLVRLRSFELPFGAPNVVFDTLRNRAYLASPTDQQVVGVDIDDAIIVERYQFDHKPETLALRPDGKRLYVAMPIQNHDSYWFGNHTGYVGEINLETPSPVREFMVDVDPFGIVATDSGWLVIPDGSGQWTEIVCFNAATGQRASTGSIRQMSTITLHPSQLMFYTADTDVSPSGAGAWSLHPETGEIALVQAGGSLSYAGGKVYVNQSGTRLVTPSGYVYTSSTNGPSNQLQVASLQGGWVHSALFDEINKALFTGGSDRNGGALFYYGDSLELVRTYSVANVPRAMSVDGRTLIFVSTLGNKTIFEVFENPAFGGGTNNPPAADFAYTPDAPTTTNIIYLDASLSTDDEQLTNLVFRWDFEADGSWETSFTNSFSATVQYGTGGPKTIRLEVMDRFGATSRTEKTLNVPFAIDTGEPGQENSPFELTFRATDLEFDRKNLRLFATDTAARKLVVLNLTNGLIEREFSFVNVPERMAVSPNGNDLYVTLQATPESSSWYMSHTGYVAHISLSNLAKVGEFRVDLTPQEIAATDSGLLAMSGRSNEWSKISIIDAVTERIVSQVAGGDTTANVGVHPSQQAFYFGDNFISPGDFKRVSVDPVTGAIQSVWDSPYHGDYALGGQPYFTADGKYILSRSGTVFSTSSTQETDLRYVTTIPYSYDMFHDAENKATFTLGPDAQNRTSVRYVDENFLLVRTEAVTNVPGISSIFGNSSNLWLVARTDNRTTVYQHKNPALALQLNQPPVVALSVTNGASLEGSLYRLWANPTETTDENRSTLTARWDWEADGAYDTDFIPLDYAYHAYPGPGTYTVRLQVRDEYGAMSVIEKSLTITRGWFEGILAGPYPHDPFRLPFAVRLAAFHPREPWLFTVAAGRRDITVINLELGHLERTFLFDHLPAAANVECMAIRPDGSRLYAAFSEGHRYDPAGGPRRGWIAEFDLTTRTLMHEYEIPIDPADIVATDDGRFVVSEGSGAFSLLMVFDAAQRTRISANGSSQGMRLVLHPSQKFIYGADVGTSPAIMHSFELLNDGTIPLHAETTPMEGDPVKGELHMSPDGMRVLSYGGIFFTTSTNKEFDLQLGGQLPVSGIHSAVFDTSRPMVAAAHGTNISFVSYGTNSFLLRRPVPADSIIIAPSSNRVALIASHPNEAIISFLDFPNEDASENVGPTINLTLFETDPVQNVGSLVNLNVVASDTDGILESVIVYNGTNVIRSGTEESFSIAEVIRPGTNILYAVATDNFNASATSMVYHVFGNHPPTVLMTAPTSAFTTYSLTTPLIVRAEAGDSDGSIATVRLLRNGEIVATDNTAPYEFEFQPGFFGNFNVQVQAVDDLGGTATSEPQIARYVRLNDNLDSTVPVLSATNLNLTAPTFNATRQKNEPMHAGVPGGRSVWWAWRPTGGTFNYSGTVTIDTAGSDFDTVLAVYTLPPQTPLNVSNLVLVASNDDSVHPPTSRVKFTAQAFQTYYFVVDGRDGVAGNAVVTLHYVQAIRPANDNIINAARVSVFGSWKGNNKSATKEEGEPAHAGNTGGSSVWLRIDSSSSGQLQISTLSSTFDTVLAVYTNVVVTPQQTAPRMQDLRIVASNDDANDGTRTSMLTFTPRSAFTTYWIAVDGYNGAEGDIEVSVRRPLISSPPNDFFADAIPLVGSSVLRDGSNRVASTEPGEAMHISSPTTASIWYRWIAPAAGPVFISTKGSDFDTVLAVYSGTNLATLSKIAANDDDPAVGKTSAVIFNAVANTEYRIAVAGYLTAQGTVVLALNQTTELAPRLLTQWSSGKLSISVTNSAAPLVLEGSVDLVEWRTLQTFEPGEAGIDITPSAALAYQFYRVRVAD